MFPLNQSLTHKMMQAQGKKSKDYFISTVDIQSYLSFVKHSEKTKQNKKRITGHFNDKIMAAYSNIIIS